MNKSHYEWKSAISSTIKDFIDEKHLAGYRFRMSGKMDETV